MKCARSNSLMDLSINLRYAAPSRGIGSGGLDSTTASLSWSEFAQNIEREPSILSSQKAPAPDPFQKSFQQSLVALIEMWKLLFVLAADICRPDTTTRCLHGYIDTQDNSILPIEKDNHNGTSDYTRSSRYLKPKHPVYLDKPRMSEFLSFLPVVVGTNFAFVHC
ncbi:hypothetical protein PsorP6_001676 [Peronosclerospora sorghi]|uniref:Uncharacterized protein n=1 Tax=Peronosclerospora sorghi TaxID=230839 RepID=A0ACC0WUY7_9STRA|nr:hypothetical protein PsorP6_001676 [Peronosclerospora sorghi]